MATVKEAVSNYCDRFTEKSANEIAIRLWGDYPGIFCSKEAARWHVRKHRSFASPREVIESTIDAPPAIDLGDKKIGQLDWRQAMELAQTIIEAKKEASWNQKVSNIPFPNEEMVSFICLGDLHFFSSGTDHNAIIKLTDEIMSYKNLYAVLLGDTLETAINLRGVAEVQSNLMPTAFQLQTYEDWLRHIKDRVIFATWDNHSSERFEKAAGCDFIGWISSRMVRFFDGMGLANLTLGEQTYKVFATHKTRGKSIYNPNHGQMRIGKFEIQDREILLAGDSHVPGISHYWDGPTHKVAVNCGTLNVNSAYSNRYFSPFANPVFPVVTVYRDKKAINTFTCGETWALAHGKK